VLRNASVNREVSLTRQQRSVVNNFELAQRRPVPAASGASRAYFPEIPEDLGKTSSIHRSHGGAYFPREFLGRSSGKTSSVPLR